MRYDDPERPSREGVRLQTNGEPLPVVTLVAPEENGAWLACIHASRGGNRFGYHSGVLPSLQDFSEAWLANPEAALERYFQYKGPEEPSHASARRDLAPSIDNLWED